jgi:hypothetical protein
MEDKGYQALYNLILNLSEQVEGFRKELKSEILDLNSKVDKLDADLQDFRKDVSGQFDLLVNDRLDLIERRQDLSAARLERVEAKVQRI